MWLCWELETTKRLMLWFWAMSKVEAIEREVEQLPLEDFLKLAQWIEQRRGTQIIRDHSAFLNSYIPEDEGLYDDVAAR